MHLALRRGWRWLASVAVSILVGSAIPAQSQTIEHSSATGAGTNDPPLEVDAQSSWLMLPTFTSNPKLGTSLGGMVGYATKFDEKSQLSLFGVSAQYTSTDSAVAAAVARTSFNADQHRIAVCAAGGRVKNDYDDYLGTGKPLKSEDNIRAVLARYLYRFKGDWFVGGQALVTNYHMLGESAHDEDILNTLGLTGFESGGVGLSVYHDSRDVQDKPGRGWVLNLNNVAYREAIAGEFDFDVYRLDYRRFWPHGKGNVVTVRQSNQWTVDAPPSAYAPVMLRGYTMGEYLGESMSSLELEERYGIAERWTATFFVGVACLYGDGLKCDDSNNVYTSVGAGVQYLLKPQQGLVANLEYAQGEDGNNGVIFKIGYGW